MEAPRLSGCYHDQLPRRGTLALIAQKLHPAFKRGNLDSIFRVSRRLAREGGREGQQFFLTSLALRGIDSTTQQVQRSANEKPTRQPLSDEDLELMLECHAALATAGDGDTTVAGYGGQVAHGPNGQTYVQINGNWVLISGGMSGGVYAGRIIEELKLAGRDEQADAMLDWLHENEEEGRAEREERLAREREERDAERMKVAEERAQTREGAEMMLEQEPLPKLVL